MKMNQLVATRMALKKSVLSTLLVETAFTKAPQSLPKVMSNAVKGTDQTTR